MISPESQSSFEFQVLLVVPTNVKAPNCEDDIKVECLWCVDCLCGVLYLILMNDVLSFVNSQTSASHGASVAIVPSALLVLDIAPSVLCVQC